jgi:methylated-DNA-[protein]-cysteine S-methyltransferase
MRKNVKMQIQALSAQTDPQAAIKTPVGLVRIFSNGTAVVGLDIVVDGKAVTPKDSISAQAAEELAAYFGGNTAKPKIKLQLEGTAFQKAVWAELEKLGFGQQASYKEIAERVGKPAAARAVGAAVGANPVPLLIGCHRVLGRGSKITGYSGGEGLKTKAWLLNHEKISYTGL